MENIRRYLKDHVRISDPEMKEVVDRIEHRLVNDSEVAIAFLRRVGILPPVGPLEERHCRPGA